MPNAPHLLRVDALVRWAAKEFTNSTTPLLDARVLAKFAFNLDDVSLIAQGDRAVDEEAAQYFRRLVERRGRAEPVAYIVGRREFWSLDLELSPGILVPRADSETLVEAVLARRAHALPHRILDLGCGSGALLSALLAEFPNARGLAVDIDPEAVALTSRNLARLGFEGRAQAVRSDWFAEVSGAFDIIVSNPPYIRTVDRSALSREVAEYENPIALFAGLDGLDAYRRILAAAPPFLAPGGLVVAEFGEGQAESVKHMAEGAFPGVKTAIETDLSGRPRAVVIDLLETRD